MSRRPRLSTEAGFTLVEVMVASAILLGGMLGVLTMLGHAATATYTTKAREQGVAVQRELVEAVRGIAYDQLSPNTVVGRVQTSPGTGLSDASASGGWTIRRRGITYSVSLGVCSVDDTADGIGAHDGASFCATGAGQTTTQSCARWLGVDGLISGVGAAASAGAAVGDCGLDLDLDGSVDNLTEASAGVCLGTCTPAGGASDPSPEDYKRVVTLVRWDRGTGARYALQSTTVANPGIASAPIITNLTTTASDPLVTGTAAAFTATINRTPETVAWYVDGTPQPVSGGAGTAWPFTWALGTASTSTAPNAGEILDGSYVVAAKAFDSYGTFGQARSLTVRLNRRAPYAPARFEAGRNGAVVDFEWSPNAERDIEGYRVYRDPEVGADVLICSLTQSTSCQDAAPVAGSANYYLVAVDRNPGGNLREGDRTTDTVRATNTAPHPPSGLSASLSGGNVVLMWSASPGDPDAGDTVDFYRVYRDGHAFGDRYDRTPSGASTTFTDTKAGGMTHTYSVVAVDQDLAESLKLGPVTR